MLSQIIIVITKIYQKEIIKEWKLNDGSVDLKEQLYGAESKIMEVKNGIGYLKLELSPLNSYIFRLK